MYFVFVFFLLFVISNYTLNIMNKLRLMALITAKTYIFFKKVFECIVTNTEAFQSAAAMRYRNQEDTYGIIMKKVLGKKSSVNQIPM